MPIEPKWKADFAAEVGAAVGCIACCQFQTVMRRTRTKRRIDDFLHDVALRRNDGCRRNDADSETAAPMTWPWVAVHMCGSGGRDQSGSADRNGGAEGAGELAEHAGFSC